MTTNLAIVETYLGALASGDVDGALALLHPAIVQVEHPNAMKPEGDRRDIAQLRRDALRGRDLFASQQYEIRGAVGEGTRLAMQVRWSGIMRTGVTMKVESAIFIDIVEGRIIAQENFDCLCPPGAGPD